MPVTGAVIVKVTGCVVEMIAVAVQATLVIVPVAGVVVIAAESTVAAESAISTVMTMVAMMTMSMAAVGRSSPLTEQSNRTDHCRQEQTAQRIHRSIPCAV